MPLASDNINRVGDSPVYDIRVGSNSAIEKYQFYVATDGNDSTGDGTVDNPYLTFNKIKNVISAMLPLDGNVGVYFREGTYRITSTEVLSTDDYDSTHSITYKSFPGENATITSNEVLSGTWVNHSGEVYYLDIPGQNPFYNLIVDGVMEQRARWPEKGKFHIMPEFDSDIIGDDRFPWDTTVGDPTSMLVGDYIDIIASYDFLIIRHKFQEVDGDYIVSQDNADSIGTGFDMQRNYGKYYFENSLNFVLNPGDWYFDQDNDRLYYYRRPGQTLANTIFEVPLLTKLISLEGDAGSMPWLTGSYTFSCWFRTGYSNSSDWEKPIISNRHNYGGTGFGFSLAKATIDGTPYEGFPVIRYNGKYTAGISISGLNNDAWHHAIFVINKSTNTSRIWIDGTECSYSISGNSIAGKSGIGILPYIGRVGGAYWEGELDTLLFLDEAITSDSVAADIMAGDLDGLSVVFNMPLDGDFDLTCDTLLGSCNEIGTFNGSTLYDSRPVFVDGGAGHTSTLSFDGVDDHIKFDTSTDPGTEVNYPGEQIKNINFLGLTFSGTDRENNLPWQHYGYEYNTDLHGAIDGIYCSGVVISDCTFNNLAGSAGRFHVSENTSAIYNTAHTLGYAGFVCEGLNTEFDSEKLWEGQYFSHNTIYDYGKISHGASAIWLLGTSRTSVTYNIIHTAPYMGIRFNNVLEGTLGGYANIEIAYNVLYDLMQEMMDGGAIGANGYCSNGLIHDNLIFDILATGAHCYLKEDDDNHLVDSVGFGLDTGGGSWKMYNNLVVRFCSQGCNVHDGRPFNEIYNNVFIDPQPMNGSGCCAVTNTDIQWCEDTPGVITQRWAQPCSVTKNIYYSHDAVGAHHTENSGTSSEVTSQLVAGWDTGGYVGYDYNLFGINPDTGNDLGKVIYKLSGASNPYIPFDIGWLQQSGTSASYVNQSAVQIQGLDREHNSVVADPLFTDYDNDDFTLQESSPAYALGFEDFMYRAFPTQTVGRLVPPPNIVTNYGDHKRWREQRWKRIRAVCPEARTTTYYFSQSGDDVTGDGSLANPFKTIAKAATLVGDDVALLFKKGDTWREDEGLVLTGNCTVSSYGTGAKPVWDRFTVRHLEADDDWTLSAGNMYVATDTTTVAAVKIATAELTQILIEQNSTANCQATSNSWYSDGSNLYINLGGDDPNDVTIDVLPANQDDGIHVYGHGNYVGPLLGYGWGRETGNTTTQKQFLTVTSNEGEVNYGYQTEAYWGATHVIAVHGEEQAIGGITLFEECVAGLCNSVGNIFNNYAYRGQETWFKDCTAAFGAAPSYLWNYATSLGAGLGFYCHTAGEDVGLHYVVGCTCTDSAWPTASLGNCENAPIPVGNRLMEARAFHVENTFDADGQARATGGPSRAGIVNYANKFYLYPPASSLSCLSGVEGETWWIQNIFDLNMAAENTAGGLWNSSSSSFILHLWYNHINLKNCVTTTANRWAINQTNKDATGAPGSGNNATSDAIGNIFTTDSIDTDAFHIGLTNQTPNLDSNAYFGWPTAPTNHAIDLEYGYDNDARLVQLTTIAAIETSHAELLEAGSSIIKPSHDHNGKYRQVDIPDIGPFDYSS